MKACECGQSYLRRQRSGPTGRKGFTVLVDSCVGCGRIYAVYPVGLAYKELTWIDRWNRRVGKILEGKMASHLIESTEVIEKSEKAILIQAPEFDEPQWVPLSQVHDDSEVYRVGDEGNLLVKEWFAEKKGWI